MMTQVRAASVCYCGFNLDHQRWHRQLCHTQQRDRRCHACRPEAGTENIKIPQILVHVSNEHAQADHVGKPHVCRFQDCLKIVERKRDLRAHISFMLGIAVCINRCLPGTYQLAARPFYNLSLIESEIQ